MFIRIFLILILGVGKISDAQAIQDPHEWDAKIRRGRSHRVQHHEEYCNNKYDNIAFQFRAQLNLTGPAGWFFFGLLLSSIVLPAAADEGTCGEEDVVSKKGSEISRSLDRALNALKEPSLNASGLKSHVVRLSPEESDVLYKDIQLIGSGLNHKVFSGNLQESRGSISKGAKIVLRCGKEAHTMPWEGRDEPRRPYEHPPGNFDLDPADPTKELRAYGKLSSVKEISNCIPDLYGCWRGHPGSVLGNHFFPRDELFCLEMEFINGTSYKEAYGNAVKTEAEKIGSMSDRVLIAHYLAHWGINRIAKMQAKDDKLIHYLLPKNSRFVAYDIGGDLFVFEPGYSLKIIDPDLYFDLNQTGKYSLYCEDRDIPEVTHYLPIFKYFYSRVSDEGKAFMNSVCEGVGLFESIKRHFEKCRVVRDSSEGGFFTSLTRYFGKKQVSLPPADQATYYRIPEEHLED